MNKVQKKYLWTISLRLKSFDFLKNSMEGIMQRADLLIELGVEEIPAGYILPALGRLAGSLKEGLAKEGLEYSEIKQFSTPRRFGIKIAGLAGEQPDEVIERIGPAKQIAYDNDGNLSKAALGFLRGAGASESDIFEVESKKGVKIAVRLEKKGKNIRELLPALLETAIVGMNFPKTMRWGSNEMHFARPLRWIVCLYGAEIIEITINGITSGRTSYGNRYSKLINPVEIAAVADYPQVLETVEVIADRSKRKTQISRKVQEIEEQSGLQIIADDRLLETVVDLVEYPTATLGSFAEKYLALPEKIIISTLSQNQKCFALRDTAGKLANKFIFTNNGNPEAEAIIRHGNEKVIGARLADAEFYYKEDTAVKLESYVSRLDDVVFQKDLGTLREKTQRVQKISEYICNELGIAGKRRDNIMRCAYLSKADLVTQMLGEKEFTKLQGYIGMKYALASGENSEAAAGIYEHYQPRGANDVLPESEPGIIVSLADKFDTVCGIMGVGLLPTGSNDPFALRRSANGIVRILFERKIELDIELVVEKSMEILKDKLPEVNNNLAEIKEFFEQRINWYLKQYGIGYDVIGSVMHVDKSNLPELLKRASSVESFRKREDFIRLVLGFKRVSNIISEQTEFFEPDKGLLSEAAERQLFAGWQELKKALDQYGSDYEKMLERLVKYSEKIDRFFDEVLVNAEDASLRANRYNLLKKVREEFLRVADLALIVVEEKN